MYLFKTNTTLKQIHIAIYKILLNFLLNQLQNATAQTCSSYEDSTIKCTEWEYDLSFYHSTLIDQVSSQSTEIYIVI